ncbi:hypothetical protein TeGR_g2174 [Tetraparma gracilis]|uniref:Uncharacterized protein n=1 Tax=Tetraparma gracilis TaxID=2962635 RepID=A0ABQ6N5E0_9STRA|nr:hypothetical protein TeGR_g2174 [Tetraparma gracilis]
MDFNPHFIEFCEKNVEPKDKEKAKFFVGDACELTALLDDSCGDWVKDSTKIVMCVGNTIGIMPDEIKSRIYQQMANVAGVDGVAVMVYWNGNSFGEALQHFYHKNPQLCGPFTGECIDLDTCTLSTPSGYKTHWTTPEEAAEVLKVEGMEIVQLIEKGRGVLAAYRRKV